MAVLMLAAGCGGEPQKLPPDQVISKAVPAIKDAQSFHFKLETGKLQSAVGGLFITGADGDVVKPDKLAANISVLFGGQPISMKVVVDGKSQYMTDPLSNRWSNMSSAFDVSKFFDPSGVADIIANVKAPTDDGTETIGGTDSYRLKGTISISGLKPLSSEIMQKGNDLPVTLWVGSSDFLLRQVRLQGPFINGDPAEVVRTITLSDYNKSVKIETPVVK